MAKWTWRKTVVCERQGYSGRSLTSPQTRPFDRPRLTANASANRRAIILRSRTHAGAGRFAPSNA